MADPLIDDIRMPEEPREFPGPGLQTPVSHNASKVTTDPVRERSRIENIQTASLVILATAAVLSLMWVAKLILVVILTAVLMAFVLAPVVDGLANFARIPRQLGALLAVSLLLAVVGTVAYLSYSRALDFLSQMPEYRYRVQHIVNDLRQRHEQFEKTTETVLPPRA